MGLKKEEVLLLAKKWNVIYPAYIDSTLTEVEGTLFLLILFLFSLIIFIFIFFMIKFANVDEKMFILINF